VTRPLPPDAEIIVRQGERLARWRGRDGKQKTAVVITGPNGTERIREESSTYYAKLRDGNGVVVEVPTGCRTADAAFAAGHSNRVFTPLSSFGSCGAPECELGPG
jgi:hypothetical protein